MTILWGLGMLTAAVACAAVSRPRSSDTPPPIPDAHFHLREMLTARERWMMQGLALGQSDPLFDKVIHAAPSLLADPTGNRAVAESLAETLVRAIETGELTSAEKQIYELLLLVNSRPTQESQAAAQALSGWLTRQRGMNALQPKGPITRSLVASLNDSWIVWLDGSLHAVDGVDNVKETYGGKTWTWREIILVRLSDGEVSSLTCEEDDGVEFSHAIAEIPLKDLKIDARRAWKMMEDEEGRISYMGKTFEVCDSGTAMYSRSRTGEKEEYHYVSLQEPGGLYIDIEDWDDEVEAFLIERIEPSRIAFAARGASI